MRQPAQKDVIDGRLLNEDEELLAFGECEIAANGDITMRVAAEHVAQPHRARGEFRLLFDDGRTVRVSNRIVRLQLRGSDATRTTTMYRLHPV